MAAEKMSSSSSDASTNSSFASQSSFEEVVTQAVRRRQERLIVVPPRRGGGSRKGKRQNVDRGRLQNNFFLLRDYFNPNPTYDDKCFRHRFRMRRCVFDCLLNAVVVQDRYFVQKKDALGVPGFSPHQKLTCALRFLVQTSWMNTSGWLKPRYLRLFLAFVLPLLLAFLIRRQLLLI